MRLEGKKVGLTNSVGGANISYVVKPPSGIDLWLLLEVWLHLPPEVGLGPPLLLPGEERHSRGEEGLHPSTSQVLG